MHFYWRVIEELKILGETWIINDPGLQRNFKRWLQKNKGAIALSAMYDQLERPFQFGSNGITPSVN